LVIGETPIYAKIGTKNNAAAQNESARIFGVWDEARLNAKYAKNVEVEQNKQNERPATLIGGALPNAKRGDASDLAGVSVGANERR